MTTHTPGPWDFHGPYMAGAYKVTALAPAGGVTLRIYVDHVDTFDTESNARLISAAPDLLEACETALALVKDTWIADHGSESVGKAWGALDDAIRKAKGE